MSFFTQHAALLADFVRMSREVGQRVEYVQGGGGNTSVKLDDRLMAIKASGTLLRDMATDDGYAVLDHAQIRTFFTTHKPADFVDVEAAGAAFVKESRVDVNGLPERRPSVEAGFHALLGPFVLHSHSVFANLVACARESAQILQEVLADLPYLLMPYTNPGSLLTFRIAEARERALAETGLEPRLVLLQNHGLVVSADSAEEALALHEEVNRRFAAYFGFGLDAFPRARLRQVHEDGWSGWLSDTTWLLERLAALTDRTAFFYGTPLYPDQIVFLAGLLMDEGRGQVAGKAVFQADGRVFYDLPQATAQLVEETLTSVLFIVTTLQEKGLTLTQMDAEACAFIAGWEAEAYRRQQLEGPSAP